jgi:hypothetical protein
MRNTRVFPSFFLSKPHRVPPVDLQGTLLEHDALLRARDRHPAPAHPARSSAHPSPGRPSPGGISSIATTSAAASAFSLLRRHRDPSMEGARAHRGLGAWACSVRSGEMAGRRKRSARARRYTRR